MATFEELGRIYRMQQLDAQLAALERERAALDDGAAQARAVVQQRRSVERLREALRQAEQAARDAELELAAVEEKLKRIQGILYSGKVVNPKELQGYEAELESLRRRKDTLEELALTRLDACDAAGARLGEARAEDAALTARWEQCVVAYRERNAALDAQKDALAQKRAALLAAVDSELRRQFEAALRQHKPLVGLVEDDVCGACGIRLPVRLVKEHHVYPEREVMCPTCAAYLLWQLPEETPAA